MTPTRASALTPRPWLLTLATLGTLAGCSSLAPPASGGAEGGSTAAPSEAAVPSSAAGSAAPAAPGSAATPASAAALGSAAAAATPAPAASAPPPASTLPREARPQYDAQGRLIGLEASPDAAQGNVLVTPGEAAIATGTLGVAVDIDAPAPLKALLERHLDVVRLGRLGREEVDEAEWSRLIDAAPAQARELLQTEGYFNARVVLQRQPRRTAGAPDRVRMTVQTGPRARISRLTFEFEGDLERTAAEGEPYSVKVRDELRTTWALAPGSEFSNAAWSAAKSQALARLQATGYANATWSGTAAQIDRERNEVRLFVVADSGPLYRLGNIVIDGLVAQDAETVRNLLAARKGAPVTEPMLLDFQERLQKANLFASINVTLDTSDPSAAANANVLVRLREAALQDYTFGIGVSANIGPRATVTHVYRRVFGYAATARNKAELGEKRQAWEGEISTHPGPDLYRNLLGGTVEWLKGDADIVLSQRVRLGRTVDLGRIERLYFVEAERAKRETDLATTRAIAYSINYHGVWRDLDSVVLPTQGFSFAGQIGFGRSKATNAETGPFTRAYTRITGYLPLGQAWYGQARVEVGQVLKDGLVIAPDSQRFRAGGDDSVRGYGYRSLGPISDGVVGSGDVVLTGSVELARPLSASLPSVWGAVFVDAGNAADSFANLSPVLGYGVGVRWRSPVGPLRVDWAYGRELRSSRLHFSIGIAF
ncbi:MAG: BamA/TamA family outer membrane protein [Burkholderiales bacterium]|nr:BamA/TamA family outer membrane protein [Burkholderiales bacterium]